MSHLSDHCLDDIDCPPWLLHRFLAMVHITPKVARHRGENHPHPRVESAKIWRRHNCKTSQDRSTCALLVWLLCWLFVFCRTVGIWSHELVLNLLQPWKRLCNAMDSFCSKSDMVKISVLVWLDWIDHDLCMIFSLFNFLVHTAKTSSFCSGINVSSVIHSWFLCERQRPADFCPQCRAGVVHLRRRTKYFIYFFTRMST